jgi:flavin reductase (DIM6/NTAB) family NADH-FMN oxidoreductase RutF
MEHITIDEAQVLSSPNPVCLICSRRSDGGVNLATVSWWTYLSNTPPQLGFALSKQGYTGKRIRADRQMALCLPGPELAEAVLLCGSSTGRKVDKVREYAIEMTSIPNIPLPVPLHSHLIFHCSLVGEVDTGGETVFYVCKAENIYTGSSASHVSALEGYGKIGTP